jgi:hypothetical protein
MERTTYDLLDEPVGELYYGLLDFARSECTLALLVEARELTESGQLIMHQLERFQSRKERSTEWPGTQTTRSAIVHYYHYDAACAEVLKTATNRLYAWYGWDLPDDLCLLRADESPWLGAIGHESYGYLDLTDEEKARLVTGLPPIAPYLRDARDRGLTHDAEMEIGALLCAWDPYQRFTDPYQDLAPECQAIHFVLTSGKVKSEEELTAYFADMYARWRLPHWFPITHDDSASVAHTIWMWWERRRGA